MIRTDGNGFFDTQIKLPAAAYSVEAEDPVSGFRGNAGVNVIAGLTNVCDVHLLGKGSLLVLVRTIAMFELTFLTAGPDSQTLVVALYYAVFAAGVRAPQSVDAMAIVYMALTLVWLLVALRFVNPTQLVSRVKEQQTAGAH